MPCSICNSDGHNARTCPERNPKQDIISSNSHALWLKFDNLTENQANELLKRAIDAKTEVAPDARGTFAKGNRRELPNKINEALALQKLDE